MDKFMEADNYQFSREGYFYRATNGHNWYYIFLTINKNNVIVEIREESKIQHFDYGTLENGDKNVYCSGGDLVCSIDIWPKYFFPEFNEDNNQWYHASKDPLNREGHDSLGCMNDVFEVMKFAYDLAIKESGIEIY